MQRLSIGLMIAVPLVLGGCGKGASDVMAGFDPARLELEDGGFTEADELPMFGIEEDVERQLASAFFLDELVEARGIGYDPADGRAY